MRTVRNPSTRYWKPVALAAHPVSLPRVNHRTKPSLAAAQAPATSHPPLTDWEHSQAMDDHWTAVTAYLAGMDFPNEG